MSGLIIKNATVTATGLQLPPNLEWEQFIEVGQAIGQIERGIQWLIGDWWAYGEHEYGTKMASCKEMNGLPSPQTCMNYGSVSRAFATISRRREVLSFTHHAEVAALPSKDADKLLKEAERKKWSTRDLREAVAAGNRSAAKAIPDAPALDYTEYTSPDPADDEAAYEDDAEYEDADDLPEAEPAPKQRDAFADERSRCIKTAEALMRSFDDLQKMRPNADHAGAIGACKRLVQIAKGWK